MNACIEIKVKLTERELEVLNLLSKGMRLKEIADILKITYRTVALHRGNSLAKLSASTHTEAVANAIRLGILD